MSDKLLPYDFVIEHLKIIIELDGQQHFEQVSNWKSPKDTQDRDMYKMQCANLHGYTVVRILQLDVWHNRNNWKTNLEEVLIQYNVPQRVFISDGDEYECYNHS